MTSESEPEAPAPGDEHAARNSALIGGAALLAAGMAVGVGMGIKMRGGAQRMERRVEDYRGAWHQIRGR
ncbi:MAG: hypothetical protein ACRDHF_15230 [Tepidiformaceae bacterium]